MALTEESNIAAAVSAAIEADKPCTRQKLPICWDMETGDPDDVITLLLLAAHPDVELQAVTITPGSREQVRLVGWLLDQVGLLGSVRLGATRWPAAADKKGCVKGQFYDNFGRLDVDVCEDAADVLVQTCNENTTLLTGAPLHNLGAAIASGEFCLGRWVGQGGFAGEGVVPTEQQLDKFRGRYTCPTWNFGGDVGSAHAALACPEIKRKVLVSKNVCHDKRAAYTPDLNEMLSMESKKASVIVGIKDADQCFWQRRAAALGLLHKAMTADLRRRPQGKQLHDPLALAVALNEDVASLAEVEMFRNRGEWGARLTPGSETWIATSFDQERFHEALLASECLSVPYECQVTSALPEIAVSTGNHDGYPVGSTSQDSSSQKRRWKKNGTQNKESTTA